MTYRGKFSKGAVVLPPGVDIPDGAEVEVTPLSLPENGDQPNSRQTLYEILKDFVGSCEGPADLAQNHDHYIHGTPKRS